MKRFISITENFLPDEINRTLHQFAESTDLYDKNINNTIWSQRVVHINQTPDEIKAIGKHYIELVSQKITTEFEINAPIFTDILCFNKWRTGDTQHPHADDDNGFGWRKFGCVLYLNEEYEGGEIYFPHQNTTLKQKANTLAFFPGDAEFLHGVKPITSGIRYTLSTFWTYEERRKVRL
jgi:predicted 2-oxoglutarate/Fe(II)-dependent dioxygenase YbiX